MHSPWKVIPSWQLLSFQGREPLYKLTLGTTLLVPTAAAFLQAFQAFDASSPSPSPLTNHLSLPVDVLRIYWASASVTVASIIYSISCPIVLRRYKSFQDWIEHDEAALFDHQQAVKRRGEKCAADILREMKLSYDEMIVNQSYSKVTPRILISICYLGSAYLLFVAFCHQLLTVYKSTSFSSLLSL